MPELLTTLKAIYEREHRKNKFMAAMQGVDIDDSSNKKQEDEDPALLEDVYSRVAKRLGATDSESEAIKQGITPEMGISYEIIKQ